MPEERSTPFPGVASSSHLDEEADAITPEETASTGTFEALNLSDKLLKALYIQMGFRKPTKIQSESLPIIITPPYKNLCAHAYCGAGKSSCFVMGMLSRIDPKLATSQALCICPTDELAKQNMELLLEMVTSRDDLDVFVPLFKTSVTSQAILGKAHVIFGTAGTIKRLIADKKLDTSGLKILMFDDADYMLIEGDSKEDSVWIMDILKQECKMQVLLCASIFNDRVKNFIDKIKDVLKLEWTPLSVEKDGPALDLVMQYKVDVPHWLSFDLKIIDKIKIRFIVDNILEVGNYNYTIIFVSTKGSAQMLHEEIVKAGYNVTNLHGALTPEHKDSILKEYKDGLTQNLITGDDHARGFDPKQANCVINYDLPQGHGSTDDCELYLHRIGRIGRHHKRGAVFNFLCGNKDKNLMEEIEKKKYNNRSIVEVPVDLSSEDFAKFLA